MNGTPAEFFAKWADEQTNETLEFVIRHAADVIDRRSVARNKAEEKERKQ